MWALLAFLIFFQYRHGRALQGFGQPLFRTPVPVNAFQRKFAHVAASPECTAAW